MLLDGVRLCLDWCHENVYGSVGLCISDVTGWSDGVCLVWWNGKVNSDMGLCVYSVLVIGT